LQGKQKAKKGILPGIIAAGAVILLFFLIFGLSKWHHFLIAGLLALLAGWVVGVMAQGLDTSQTAPVQRKLPKTGDQTADGLISRGQEMLSRIRKENDLIADAPLSAQIDSISDTAERIFETVAEQPQKAYQLRRFMDYYMPTTLKMLEAFRRMEERAVEGEAANATRDQIRTAMDAVVRAFEKQLSTLHQEDYLDISTDIDVLEAMLRQDGLLGGGPVEP